MQNTKVQALKVEKELCFLNPEIFLHFTTDPIAGIKLDDYSPQSPLDIVIRLIHDIENRSIRLEGIYSDKAYFNMEEMGK